MLKSGWDSFFSGPVLGSLGGGSSGSCGSGSDSGSGSGSGSRIRDQQSPYAVIEQAAALDDTHRPAVALAHAFQKRGFPFVSVVHGGFSR